MKRRTFLKSAAALTGTTAGRGSGGSLSPRPRLNGARRRAFQKASTSPTGRPSSSCRQVGELTDGKFTIQQFAAGELVPGLQAMDAASNGTVEVAYTGTLFYVGKDPTFALAASVPFLMNPRQQHGLVLSRRRARDAQRVLQVIQYLRPALRQYRHAMGRLVPEEIKSVADLSGLKMRIAGLAGTIAARVGVVPRSRSRPAISIRRSSAAPSMRSNISAPMTTRSSASRRSRSATTHRAGRRGGTLFHALINLSKWNELPPLYRKAVEVAAQARHTDMLAHYDTKNPESALRACCRRP